MKHLRVWDEARTSHFEMLGSMQAATLVYRRKNYSFDESAADKSGAEQLNRLQAAKLILMGDWDTIELNEPTMAKLWPSLAIYIAAARIRPLLRRSRVTLVTYAIDNADMVECMRRRAKFPRFFTRFIIRTLIRRFDRLAFGTSGALDAYARYDPELLSRRGWKVFEYVPSACDCGDISVKSPGSVLFVSSFESRKGVEILKEAWQSPSLAMGELTMVGKGPLQPLVQEWGADTVNVQVVIDPPREEIHELLRTHQVVVLPSRPADCWREQVGLPIVEGLAHGCTIVTSNETGVASWLQSNGHFVTSDPLDVVQLRENLRSALSDPLPAESVLLSLPNTSSRVEADSWMRE